MKSKEVKSGCKPAESSKENYDSKRAVLPMMMMLTKREDRQTGVAFPQYVNFMQFLNEYCKVISICCFIIYPQPQIPNFLKILSFFSFWTGYEDRQALCLNNTFFFL
jgi:hypothetical protein